MWETATVCQMNASMAMPGLAKGIYQRVCRTNFNEPGFCLLDFGSSIDSHEFRGIMINLKEQLAIHHEAVRGQTLIFCSAARFDQQTTTKLHLDGGPVESFLMLGYEPSEIRAEVQLADYAKCAHDLGLTPQEFMTKHNPMFRSGAELLAPYVTRIPCFSNQSFQIICINNSSAPFDGASWQGLLHAARIANTNDAHRRIINSTMICPAEIGAPEGVPPAELQDFANSSAVRRRGYDRLNVEDDE
jgi:hypothetical protein